MKRTVRRRRRMRRRRRCRQWSTSGREGMPPTWAGCTSHWGELRRREGREGGGREGRREEGGSDRWDNCVYLKGWDNCGYLK